MENQADVANVNLPTGISRVADRKVIRRKVWGLYLKGLTYAEIGAQCGFSRQRAQQLTRPPLGIQAIVKRRAAGKCENCGLQIESGHLHHVWVGQTLDNFNTPDMILYLCVGCHCKADLYGSRDSIGELLKTPLRRFPALSGFMREIGKKGGKALAKKYSKETRAKWGRLGGRPRRKQT